MSEDYIRAGVGIADPMRRPTVEMRARAGIRTPRAADAPPPTAADYIVGPALDAAERAGEAIEIVWPIVAADLQSSKGKSTAPRKPDGVQNWAALEAVLCVRRRVRPR